MEVCTCSYFRWCRYFWGLAVICYNRWVLIEGQEITLMIGIVFNLFLSQWIMAISKGCNPGNFELRNSLNLSFTNVWGLCSNFVECESFLESNTPDTVLCDTNLDDSFDSGNFFVRGYLPLIRKDSSTHLHGLAVYVKKGLPSAWDLSLENSYLCFQLALLHSGSYFFFLYQSPSLLCMDFYSNSSNIDGIPLINPFADVFVFGDFSVYHKHWGHSSQIHQIHVKSKSLKYSPFDSLIENRKFKKFQLHKSKRFRSYGHFKDVSCWIGRQNVTWSIFRVPLKV